MITVLAGLSAFLFLWWIAKIATRVSPKVLARFAKTSGGILALLAAGIMGLRGRLDMALFCGGVGIWLLGWGEMPGFLQGRFGPRRRVLRQRSALLEVAAETGGAGRITGTVIGGSLAGRSLDSLAAAELLALRRDCLEHDRSALSFLEAYLDRRLPGWREHAEPRQHDGRRAEAQRRAMSEEEAYEILGLQPGADPDSIRAAHRTLIKKLHPDQGGSTYLAARVNQARDVLLNRHR